MALDGIFSSGMRNHLLLCAIISWLWCNNLLPKYMKCIYNLSLGNYLLAFKAMWSDHQTDLCQGAMLLTVMQGSIQEELYVPHGTLISELGSIMAEWEHASKFTFSESGMAESKLNTDGDEYPWQDILEVDDALLSAIVGEAEKVILVIGMPQQQEAAAELLPVMSALDEELEPLPVHAGVTILKVQELLSQMYNGNLDATVIQIRGTGTSFLSLKLATSQSTLQLMDCVKARVLRTPELLRPPMPEAVAELRIKLGVGVVPKALLSPAEAAGLGNEHATEFAIATKAKVRIAIARAQKEDNKRPEDMERLLIVDNRAIAANFKPPLPGKKNGGQVSNTHALARRPLPLSSSKSSSSSCSNCNSRG